MTIHTFLNINPFTLTWMISSFLGKERFYNYSHFIHLLHDVFGLHDINRNPLLSLRDSVKEQGGFAGHCKDLSVDKKHIATKQRLWTDSWLWFCFSVSPDQVFGCSLSSLCHRENGTVPSFVTMCIDHVENNGVLRYVSLWPDLSEKEMILVYFNLPVVKEGWGLRPHDNTGVR